MSEEETIGTVEGHTYTAADFDRNDQSLWIGSRFGRVRVLCPKCKKGQHTLRFDSPCNLDCECLCKTHYIGRDGRTKIPFGVKDHTTEIDDDPITPSNEFMEVMEDFADYKQKPKQA